jgi:hypothetical protein
MRDRVEPSLAVGKFMACAAAAIGLSMATTTSAPAQAWQGYSHDAKHTCIAGNGSQYPDTIRWQTPVDLNPQYSGSDLLTHFGSPMITGQNIVLVPVKTGASGGFRLDAHRGSDGSLLWRVNSDYTLPNYNWIPPWGPTLVPNDAQVAMAGAGGTVLVRKTPNSAAGLLGRYAFYNLNYYRLNPGAFNSAIHICTPITSDSAGNLYFGYVGTTGSLPGYPNGIPSGLARISKTGVGTFASAASLSGDNGMTGVAYNCAPAVSGDGSSVYVAVSDGYFGNGYLCKVNSTTLARQASVYLLDPRNPAWGAIIANDGTASPTIGPDGDVYYGVLEYNIGSNHDRGWMLHFSADLATTKTPGAFGWDDTASIVPAGTVPQYNGSSHYLILTKYNNYAAWGDGHNKLAILDPNATQVDPITGATVMREVITVLGPTPDPEFGGTAVREWCINSAAIDTKNRCAVVNSEDGHVYRWDFATNSLSPPFPMAAATGEAYTPTVIGPDGAVYAINNATLYCCISSSGQFATPQSPTAQRLATPGGSLLHARMMIDGAIVDGEGPEKSKR